MDRGYLDLQDEICHKRQVNFSSSNFCQYPVMHIFFCLNSFTFHSLANYTKTMLIKVTATSLKLEIRLHAHQVGALTHDLVQTFGTRLLNFACSLISGLNNGPATLRAV